MCRESGERSTIQKPIDGKGSKRPVDKATESTGVVGRTVRCGRRVKRGVGVGMEEEGGEDKKYIIANSCIVLNLVNCFRL